MYCKELKLNFFQREIKGSQSINMAAKRDYGVGSSKMHSLWLCCGDAAPLSAH